MGTTDINMSSLRSHNANANLSSRQTEYKNWINDANIAENGDDLQDAVMDLHERSLRELGWGKIEQVEDNSMFSQDDSFSYLTSRPSSKLKNIPTLHYLKFITKEDHDMRKAPCVLDQGTVDKRSLRKFLLNWQPPTEGLTWIHIDHVETLHEFAMKAQTHPLMLKMFTDPRHITAVNHLDYNTVCITAVSVYFEAAELHSHKLCIYATPYWLVTFERELMRSSDSDNELSKDKIFLEVQRGMVMDLDAMHSSSSSFDLPNLSIFNQSEKDHDNIRNVLKTTESSFFGYGDRFFGESKNDYLKKLVGELGCGFLVYLLLMELTKLNTSTLESYAEAIFCLHQEVHNPISLNQRVGHLRDLNILYHGIEILEAHFQQATSLGLRSSQWKTKESTAVKGGGKASISGGGGGDRDDGETSLSNTNFSERVAPEEYFDDDDSEEEDIEERPQWGGAGRAEHGFVPNRNAKTQSNSNANKAQGSNRQGAGSSKKGQARRDSSHHQKNMRRNDGGGGDDKFVIYNRCIQFEHMPYFRDIENVALASLRQLDVHEASLGEMRTTLTDVGTAQATQTDTALSLVATMFLPLTFLAGVFGMNFAYQAPGHDEPRPGIGIGMLNARYGALYFWYIVGIIVLTNLFFYDVNGWSEHFTLDAARPYQSKFWDLEINQAKTIDKNYDQNRTYRRRKRKLIYITLLTLWCCTPYTFHLMGHNTTLLHTKDK